MKSSVFKQAPCNNKEPFSISMPLLEADTGVVVELPEPVDVATGNLNIPIESLRSMMRFISIVGFSIGILVPFAIMETTLLVANWCRRLDIGIPAQRELFLIMVILWGVTIIFLAASVPCIPRRVMFQYFGIEKVTERLEEHVETRLALGTLVGVLIAEVGHIIVLKNGFLSYAGSALGCALVLSYFCFPCHSSHLEDFEDAMSDEEKDGILVV